MDRKRWLSMKNYSAKFLVIRVEIYFTGAITKEPQGLIQTGKGNHAPAGLPGADIIKAGDIFWMEEKKRAELADALNRAVETIKIGLSPAEREDLLVELELFVEWLEPLKQSDTSGIAPLLFAHDRVNAMRKDEAEAGNLDNIREASPGFDDGFYPAPRIIEQ